MPNIKPIRAEKPMFSNVTKKSLYYGVSGLFFLAAVAVFPDESITRTPEDREQAIAKWLDRTGCDGAGDAFLRGEVPHCLDSSLDNN